jgi:hypothetical protein
MILIVIQSILIARTCKQPNSSIPTSHKPIHSLYGLCPGTVTSLSVGFASPVNGTIENPDSGTMVNDDVGFTGDGAGVETLSGAASGVVTKVGVSTGGGMRGTPLVRLEYRVVVT